MLTTDTWKDRLLGASQMVSAPVKCLWLATGNNPTLSHEISRRTVPIRLDANVERPWLREGFRYPDLLLHVRAHRNELVWATLTVISAWVAAGRPKGPKRLGMYEDWADVVGGVLEVAGLRGFLENLDSLYEAADAETVEWDGFLSAWFDRFGERAVKVKELFEIADEALDLGTGTDHSRKTALGKALHARRGRIIGGKRVLDLGTHQGATRWRVQVVDGDPGEGREVNGQSAADDTSDGGWE